MFTINGMDYLNSFGDNNKSGATNDSLGANEMQSVTVVNNGYSGNYGRMVGSNVNFVTKSGVQPGSRQRYLRVERLFAQCQQLLQQQKRYARAPLTT